MGQCVARRVQQHSVRKAPSLLDSPRLFEESRYLTLLFPRGAKKNEMHLTDIVFFIFSWKGSDCGSSSGGL